jgi:Gluconate 2-dehydrogenase subunit 3
MPASPLVPLLRDAPAQSRRAFLKQGALFAFAGARSRLLTPAAARAAAVPYRVFNQEQVRTLEALGEALVPGSAKAGLAHFIDVQLSGPPADSLLMIKYLGLNAPFTEFYKSGLGALNTHSAGQFRSLPTAQARALLMAMAKDDLPDWRGPPAPLFYFVLRNDAVDVVYATMAGYESLGVPYMAHIAPRSGWVG